MKLYTVGPFKEPCKAIQGLYLGQTRSNIRTIDGLGLAHQHLVAEEPTPQEDLSQQLLIFFLTPAGTMF